MTPRQPEPRQTSRFHKLSGAALAGAVLVALSVSAQDRGTTSSANEGSQKQAQTDASGATSAAKDRAEKIDELLRRLGPALTHSHEGLTSEPGAQGTRVTRLQGRFHHVMVAHVDEDGQVHYGCVNSHEQAKGFLLRGEKAE